ncbi:hypothetical protein SAMN05428970_3817 [Agromyces sp. CF514]|uniref:hypothetical protein n=1 Tax=Agromyces sp. CF514 TaxID=1881031 RepID=UPI0008EC7603|nr:hypothetical protein [Agromyces sp. CF514]SFR91593.1 hypothetical protein SAMN05428970_3817 [Agromyces sp. CF514]
MNDFELSRRLSDARPDLPRRGDDLSPSAETRLRRITTSLPAARPRRRSPIFLSVAAAVALLLAVAIGMLVIARPATVYAAATPPLLHPTPIDGTPEELLMGLSTKLAPGPTTTTTVKTQSWYRNMVVGDDGTIEQVTINPEIRTFEQGPQGARIEVRRGEPYDSDGRPIVVEGYEVGSLAWEQDFGPGEWQPMYGTPPNSAAEFGAFLRAPMGAATYTTGEYVNELRGLLGERRLTTEQSKAALEFLASLPDLEVEGEVVDRLGRSGISFSTASRAPGEFVDHVVVSDEGLGIITIETTYVGHDRTDVQAPSVWGYEAFE